MADNLRKYTTQEVLNKVYTDSSGNAIGVNSSTTKETLNAVFSTSDNSLNVALSGGTISGDVTISGDLTVNGSNTNANYDEIVNGNLVVSSGNKLGVGTETPDFTLHVHGASDGDGYVKISDGNTGEGATDGARIGFNSGVMRIQNFENSDMEFYVNNSTKPLVLESDGSATFSGDVNIKSTGGNDDPATLALWSPDVSISADDTIGTILAQGSDSGGSPPYLGGKIEFNADANWDTGTSGYYPTRIDFFTESNSGTVSTASPRMTLDSSGRVGMGASPSYPLHVENASDTVAYFKSTDNNGQIAVVDDDTTAYFGANGSRAFMGTASGLSGNTNLVVDSNGNVVVGQTTAQQKFEVHGGGIRIAGNIATPSSGVTGALIDYFGSDTRFWSRGADASTVGSFKFIGLENDGGNQSTFFILDSNSSISLSNNDSGTSNTLFGKDAGDSDGGGDFNVFIGELSGGTGTQTDDADGNVGIGYRALTDVTSGNQNIAIGKDSLTNITSGDSNIGIGSDALGTATTSEDVVAIGRNAGYAINHIDANGTTAIGTSSLALLTNGRQNTAVGFRALETTANGDRNTAVGHLALGNVTGNNNGDNTAIGHNAGHDGTNNLTSGTGNTLIGSSTRVSSATAVNQTVIGYNAIGGGDNSVVLGDSDVSAVLCASDGEAQVYASAIRFPAAQVANSNANALDDYEEGVWTPILSDGTNNFTMVSNQNGRYTKIGRVVHFEAECGTSSIGSASGDLKLIGLPFASASSTSEGSCSIGFLRSFNYSADTIQLMAQVNGNTTEIGFTASKDDTTEESVQCSQADSSSFFIRISGTYFV
jgi:hypothetical protein